MSHLFYLLLFTTIAIPQKLIAQKKWDGGGGNNQWSNALNWAGNSLPLTTDDIVLDNSVVTSNYFVQLPGTAVTVRSITISPAINRAIELSLPSANTQIPGLTVNGPGYGLVINSGGTFKNSSGSTSGNTVVVNDSIRVNNDGRYVHNSASAHTNNVQKLATIAGTEAGIFEFDIPTASSTISFSGRTFGKFVLRSTAAGGTCNYTAAGTTKVNIRNMLDIGAGVTFNLNCSDSIMVRGDFLQDGPTFNLGNSTRSVVLSLQQNITQGIGTAITETGTGTQTILINGPAFQLVTFRGTITNQVALVKDGAGVVLSKSAVNLPYRLTLKNGRINTTQGLFTLAAACTISADTLSNNSFIEGPLKKDGLAGQSFLFPVGRAGMMRWLQLVNATGNFTVEYFRTDPTSLSATTGTGIHHFSKVEYWDVTTTAGSTSQVKLSFALPGSGTVTDLSTLRVARLINGTWENAGSVGVAGSPGSDGWVSSLAASGFSAGSKSFALASAMSQENPLPISSVLLSVARKSNEVIFSWKADADMKIGWYELQESDDGRNYRSIFKSTDNINVQFVYSTRYLKQYYRLLAATNDGGDKCISNTIKIAGYLSGNEGIVGSNIVSSQLKVRIPGESARVLIYDGSGKLLNHWRFPEAGNQIVDLNIEHLRPGSYFIEIRNQHSPSVTSRFVKL